jgi:hypothetical protein
LAWTGENGLKILPNNRILLYLAGYARGRLAKELLGGLHREKAKRELSEARKLLEKALKISDDLGTRAKMMNTDIYRALVLIY